MALYEKQEPTVQNNREKKSKKEDDADDVKAWHVAHLS
jgi:hypothetical protein